MFVFKRFGLCSQAGDDIENIKMTENANSDDRESKNDFMEHDGSEENNEEVLENSLSHEKTQKNEGE